MASAGVAANANEATGCSSGAAPSRPRNPSSPGRNGQLPSKFSRYYPPRYTSTAGLYRTSARTSLPTRSARARARIPSPRNRTPLRCTNFSAARPTRTNCPCESTKESSPGRSARSLRGHPSNYSSNFTLFAITRHLLDN